MPEPGTVTELLRPNCAVLVGLGFGLKTELLVPETDDEPPPADGMPFGDWVYGEETGSVPGNDGTFVERLLIAPFFRGDSGLFKEEEKFKIRKFLKKN